MSEKSKMSNERRADQALMLLVRGHINLYARPAVRLYHYAGTLFDQRLSAREDPECVRLCGPSRHNRFIIIRKPRHAGYIRVEFADAPIRCSKVQRAGVFQEFARRIFSPVIPLV